LQVCEIDDWGLITGKGRNFSLRHCVQTGVHPTSYKVGTEGSTHGTKLSNREIHNSLPHRPEHMNVRSYTSTPPFIFMAWCLGIGRALLLP